MQIHKITTIGISLIALLPAAVAQGFYVDGGYATSSLNVELGEDEDAFTVDLDLGAVGGHAGYDFSKYFGIEGEVLVGVQDDTQTVGIEVGDDTEEIDIDFSLQSIYGVYAKASLPIGDQFSAFARLGYAVGKLEGSTDSDELETETDTEEGVAFGAGAMFDFTDQIYVRGDYTRYDFGESESDSFMAGVGFRF